MAETSEARVARLERTVNALKLAFSLLVGSIAIVDEAPKPKIIHLLEEMVTGLIDSSTGEARILAEIARNLTNTALSDLKRSSSRKARRKTRQ